MSDLYWLAKQQNFFFSGSLIIINNTLIVFIFGVFVFLDIIAHVVGSGVLSVSVLRRPE